jgi:adenylylsulfate kinase
MNIVWHNGHISKKDRESLHGHKGIVLWFTGLSNSGKSTIAHTVEKELYKRNCSTYVFDGDNVRHGLCSDLGFSLENRAENIRRIGEMCKLFIDAGIIALTAFISPLKIHRQQVRNIVGDENFIEIYCKCPLEVCEQRDVKGHYKMARAGEIKEFTGISSPYEEPENPDLILETAVEPLQVCAQKVLQLLESRGVVF